MSVSAGKNYNHLWGKIYIAIDIISNDKIWKCTFMCASLMLQNILVNFEMVACMFSWSVYAKDLIQGEVMCKLFSLSFSRELYLWSFVFGYQIALEKTSKTSRHKELQHAPQKYRHEKFLFISHDSSKFNLNQGVCTCVLYNRSPRWQQDIMETMTRKKRLLKFHWLYGVSQWVCASSVCKSTGMWEEPDPVEFGSYWAFPNNTLKKP